MSERNSSVFEFIRSVDIYGSENVMVQNTKGHYEFVVADEVTRVTLRLYLVDGSGYFKASSLLDRYASIGSRIAMERWLGAY